MSEDDENVWREPKRSPAAWTVEHVRELEATGDWFADKRWRDPAYIASSPFSEEEHEEIFGALETFAKAQAHARVSRAPRRMLRCSTGAVAES